MFKNIMLVVMSIITVGWVLIYGAGQSNADRGKKIEFEYIGQAGSCSIYRRYVDGIYVFVATSSACSIAIK